ncbi:glycosyltransferase [Aquimarina pacifica]|uniref:glycosyltransferase n=1 Tax=Aquimarina pacifica TaxID=1296415 RepID=UPI0013788AC2|nr:glycosyltransferase [Aquimarina pacifica]
MDTSVHLLFIAPKINVTDYYSMFLPYLELTTDPRFSIHLLEITKENFTLPFDLPKFPLLDSWILWADYVIFPEITERCSYFFKALKTINPDLEIVMFIRQVFHYLDTDDPLKKKITPQMLTYLEENMNHADLIVSHNERILDAYERALKKKFGVLTPSLVMLPLLISYLGYEGLVYPESENTHAVRIGLLGNLRTASDMLRILPVLQHIHTTYQDTLVFVVYGWDGVLSDGTQPFEGLPIEYHKEVGIMHYFQKLVDLQLDILLLPLQSRIINTFQSERTYLEAASLGIPVVAAKDSIYSEVIEDNKTGVLAHTDTEWETAVSRYIEKPEERKRIGEAAAKMVWEFHSFTEEQKNYFAEVFI